jgi:hypothetical protein
MNKKLRNKYSKDGIKKQTYAVNNSKHLSTTDLLNKQFEDLLTVVIKQTVQSLYQKEVF